MDIVNEIFGKKIGNLQLSDITNHFLQNKEESEVIEYKSFHIHNNQNDYKHKEKVILKTICAFLNSSGGLLIWGAPVEEKNGDEKVFSGELTPVDRIIIKDNFISKIVNAIVPTPTGINMQIIKTGNNNK